MPKVTKEHVEARRAQILNAAGICFAQKGFQKTTIKDICARAELSAGAVYSYFESKDAIIKALADENIRQNEIEMAKLKQAATFRDALKGFIDILRYFEECRKVAEQMGVDVYKMKVSLWAECIRHPEMMGVNDIYGLVVTEMQKSVRRAQRKGEVRKDLDSKLVAPILFSLLEGFTLQQAIGGSINTDKYITNVMRLLEGGMLEGVKARRGKR